METDRTQLEALLEQGFEDLEQGRVHHFDSLEDFQKAVLTRVNTTNSKTFDSTLRNSLQLAEKPT
jgi:hypothetical protein